MSERTKIIENKIASLLPSSFALLLDGCSCTSTRFLGVFASFHSDSSRGYETCLVTFSPPEDESSLSTEDHYTFVSRILELYGKVCKNVSCLVRDNRTSNKATDRHAKAPPVGCASNRFNLAMKMVLQEDEALLEKVIELIES